MSVCAVCSKVSSYTCPRCCARYCSAVCYKAHGLRCTEAFYQEQVFEELSGSQTSVEERKKMLDILSRMRDGESMEALMKEVENEEDEDSVHEEFVGTVLERMKLREDLSFDQLTGEQQQAFKKAVAKGLFDNLLEPWDPWWNRPDLDDIGVVPLDDGDSEIVEEIERKRTRVPPLAPSYPPLASLTKVAVSGAVVYSIVDLVYAYVSIMRVFDGDVADNMDEVVADLISVSGVVSSSTVYTSTASATQLSIERAVRPPLQLTSKAAIGLLSDVTAVLSSKRFTMSVLQELYVWTGRVVGAKRKSITVANKRMTFLLSWCNEQSPSLFARVAADVQRELAMRSATLDELAETPPLDAPVFLQSLSERNRPSNEALDRHGGNRAPKIQIISDL